MYWVCLLVVVTLALYNPVSRNGFVNFDDDRYVTDNPQVRVGLRWSTISWAFTSLDQANWHPLTWLSHALDCQFFQLNPVGHHYTNLLLHATNALLLVSCSAVVHGIHRAQPDGSRALCRASS